MRVTLAIYYIIISVPKGLTPQSLTFASSFVSGWDAGCFEVRFSITSAQTAASRSDFLGLDGDKGMNMCIWDLRGWDADECEYKGLEALKGADVGMKDPERNGEVMIDEESDKSKDKEEELASLPTSPKSSTEGKEDLTSHYFLDDEDDIDEG